MAFVDKHGVLDSLGRRGEIVVDLGCGERKREGAIGIDRVEHDSVDLTGDAIEILGAFPDASIDRVVSSHFVEHLPDVAALVDLLARKVRPGGAIEIVVPHFTNPYFHSDPTHRSSFGLYTFCYFCRSTLFRREVPSYVRRPQLRLARVDLVFKASRPFYLRHALRRLAGALFNSNAFFQELYEDCFSYWFPCYEIRYRIERVSE